MRNMRVWVLAILLSVIGVSVMLYKHVVLEFPLSPDTTYNSWYLEARVDITAKNPWKSGDKPLSLKMQLPTPGKQYVVVNETIIANGFGQEISLSKKRKTREAIFTKRKMDARETIFYRASIYELDSPVKRNIKAPAKPRSPYAKKNRTKPAEGEEIAPIFIAIDALIAEARGQSSSDKSFVREMYKLSANAQDDRIQLIHDTVDDGLSTVKLAQLLIEANGIPTRIAHGLKLLADQRNAPFVSWLEAYVKNRWLAIDPEQHRYDLQGRYTVWWYGDAPFVQAEGKMRAETSVAVRKNTNNALTRAIWKSGQLADILLTFSFYNLPIDSQLVFQILLMIPIGGLVMAFLRQIVGLNTFGTFMPVLIALALRETGLVSGIFLFALVVAIGLLFRNYFDHLKLLLVPRLASVLTVVVIMLALMSMLANQIGATLGLSIALFPIVILTMTIERMTLLWEEYGAEKAIYTGLQSLLASVIAYFVMNIPALDHLIFTFPELLLVVLALTLLIGRYNYYKLSEYIRFRQLARALDQVQKMHDNAAKPTDETGTHSDHENR
jgi:hypothetical protein